MKTLFVLMNHELLPAQYQDAIESLGVTSAVSISDVNWSQISPDDETISHSLEGYKQALIKQAQQEDFLLVQGDFGATYHMIRFARSLGLIPIYATTKRHATQEIVDGAVITKREFIHVRFREYEEI